MIRSCSSRGTTLLEVMVTVSLLSFGMGAVFQALNTCMRTQARVQERKVAARLAEQVMLEGKTGAPEASGPFEPPYEDYSWSARTAVSTSEWPPRLTTTDIWRRTSTGKVRVYGTQRLTL